MYIYIGNAYSHRFVYFAYTSCTLFTSYAVRFELYIVTQIMQTLLSSYTLDSILECGRKVLIKLFSTPQKNFRYRFPFLYN